MNKCKVKNCTGNYLCKGYCTAHYLRIRTGKSLKTPIIKRIRRHKEFCAVKDCKNKFSAKGFCEAHYRRFRIYGNPLAQIPIMLRKGQTKSSDYSGYTKKNCKWASIQEQAKNRRWSGRLPKSK